MSQPALSQNIALLEAHVGAALFIRTTRTVRLTAEGLEFHRHLADALPALHHAVDSVRNFGKAPGVKLRLGFLASAVVSYLPAALSRFRNECPEVEVLVRDDTAEGLFNAIHRGDLDLAVSSFLPHGDMDVDFEEIIRDPFYAVMRRDHPLATQKAITWAELVQYDIIGANVGSGTRFAIDAAMLKHGRSVRTVMDFNHFLAVAGMVEAGMGVGALPLMICPRSDHPMLCAIELVDPVVTRNLGIITGNRSGDLSGHVIRFRNAIFAAAAQASRIMASSVR